MTPAYSGTDRHVVICGDCDGHGHFANGFGDHLRDCENCSGEGEWTACDWCGEPECDCALELAA